MEEYYYVDYKKYARIYFFMPIFFYFWVSEPGLAQGELNYGVGGGTIASIALLHIFYVMWVKKKWYVVLRDEEFETFSMNGKRSTFRYDNLNAPTANGFLVVMLYLFSLRSDYKASSCITDWIEDYEECYRKIEEKRRECEAKRENENSETSNRVSTYDEQEIVPRKKSSFWGTVALVIAVAIAIYLRLQILGGG